MSVNEFIYFNKKKIFLFIGLVVVGIFVVWGYFYYFNDEKRKDVNAETKQETPGLLEKKEEVVEDVNLCYFDIKGEVKKPGVYAVECDKRIIDAINVSGGLTKNSDTSVLNLSKKIEDGMVILVYSKKEVSSYLETLEKNEKKQSICDNSNIKNDACEVGNDNTDNTSNTSLININTATINELMTLTGIGESKAKNIIAYREKTPFKTKEDILNVEGIGESIYVNIKENITV